MAAQALVLNAISGFGLVAAAYRTAKVLRRRAEVESVVIDPAASPPQSPPPNRRASRRITLTPAEAAPFIAQYELKEVTWLKFWVLLGAIQCLAEARVWYAAEVRSALAMLALLPLESLAQIVAGPFEGAAEPFFGGLVASALAGMHRRALLTAAALSPLLCTLTSFVITPDVLAAASAEDLRVWRAAMAQCAERLATERDRRRLHRDVAGTAAAEFDATAGPSPAHPVRHGEGELASQLGISTYSATDDALFAAAGRAGRADSLCGGNESDDPLEFGSSPARGPQAAAAGEAASLQQQLKWRGQAASGGDSGTGLSRLAGAEGGKVEDSEERRL